MMGKQIYYNPELRVNIIIIIQILFFIVIITISPKVRITSIAFPTTPPATHINILLKQTHMDM